MASKPGQDAATDAGVGVTPDEKLVDSNAFEQFYPYKDRITATSFEDATSLEKAYPGLRFVQTSGKDLPFPDGAFDLAFLGCLPGMVLMAPSDEVELRHMVATATAHEAGPSAARYPRGEGLGLELPARGLVLPIGRGRVLREGGTVAILSLGTRLADSLKAAEDLAARGLSTTVADARFAKPFDRALVEQLARHHEVLVDDGATRLC